MHRVARVCQRQLSYMYTCNLHRRTRGGVGCNDSISQRLRAFFPYTKGLGEIIMVPQWGRQMQAG